MPAPDGRKDPGLLASFGFASSIGLQFGAAVLVGIGLGLLADRFAHTSPWFMLLGLVLGIASGAYTVVRTAMKEMRR